MGGAGRAAAALVSLTVCAVVLGPAPATGRSAPERARGVALKIVAHGLHGPRDIAFGPHGVMYVAEAGQGGTGTCVAGGDGPSCFGWTGSVMRVRKGKQHRVLSGLASLSDQGTHASPIGPSGLAVVGGHTLVLTSGLGAAPKARGKLKPRAQRQLGHLLSVDLRTRKVMSVADLAAYERKKNPVDGPDSDPAGLVKRAHGSWLVADAGGNDLVSTQGRKVRTVARLHDRKAAGRRYESVPTDVVRGPDGAFYVSELTGYPYPRHAARIWRVVPGHKPKVWATGLTNVTGLAWAGKRLYAVQIADRGLANAGSPLGSLRRVFPKSSGKASVAVATNLFAPYGVAIHAGAATCRRVRWPPPTARW
ncbi:MAG: ScyD/ScyE family protein [Nocardioides sp.]